MGDTKGKKAFTTMELLVAVAVVVALLAVSMPLVSNLVSGLKLRELDGYAKSIYLEAQDQLIAMRAEGSLGDFAVQVEELGQQVSEMPDDFAEGDDTWKNLCYLNTTNPIIKKLLPTDASLDGNYLIELNPESGTVYGVFYWEKEAAIDYAQDIQTLESRESADRKASKIGYYGGALEDTAQESFDLDQQISIKNGEELYVEISYAASATLRKYYKNAGVFQVALTLTGANESETYTRTIEGKDISMEREGDRLKLYVLLDSMLPSQSFFQITAGKLTPGTDVTVAVLTTFQKGAIQQTAQGSETVNSLFGSKADGEIHIRALRHLRNLDQAYYKYASSDNITAIVLDSDIDFAAGAYVWTAENGSSKYIGNAERPIETFSPLENDALFQPSAGVVALRGNSHALKNFVITDDKNAVGIIRKIDHMTISGVHVQDIQVRAAESEYVGGFAGSIKNSTVTGSGIYLSTTDENGEHYSQNPAEADGYADEMEQRWHTYTVSGKNEVGGFCGTAKNVQFSESFGAVMVSGSAMVGGFCGNAEADTTFANCYSSGAVTADRQVGGFAGKLSGAILENCYTTGEVMADAEIGVAGGFVGASQNSTYKKCISYAKLSGMNGKNHTSGGFGVFLGHSNTAGDTFENCSYLNQYNQGFVEARGIKGRKYTKLKSKTANSVEQSSPYSAALVGSAFPFELVTNHHYGNWQGQYVIDTSLVYFEKYEDGAYGYYCVTTATELGSENPSAGEEGQEEEKTGTITWVLDTLQDKICIEDGYALLTLYNLKSFDYLLDIGSAQKDSAPKTLKIANSYGDSNATKLTQQGTLKFKGYEGALSADTDFSKETAIDNFSVSGMYLYQLPYALQTADREGVSNFYDKLTIYNGIAKNESVVIGGEAKEDGMIFYYCPHFAKTAVNPQITKNDDTTNGGLKNPSYVSVRSAKQLNAMGRYTYYWNNKKGMEQTLYFKQEADISFSKYVKTYCGKTFNLMDTSKSNALRNQPIGQPKSAASPGQFNNQYDGNGYCIIDYCLESSNQFVGFFGEVEDGKIENIILTVSERGKGYIRGSYDSNKSTAVGGIVGLSYKNNNLIKNCSVSGYTVEYSSSTSPQVYSINVGGLVGASMSELTNCSADCDVRAKINGKYTYALSLGGLAGTAYYDTLSNSYAGGTIQVQTAKDEYIQSLGGLAAGGIAGAALKIYNNMSKSLKLKTSFTNLYSYTQILIDDKFKNAKKFYISPIVAKEKLETHTSQEDYGPALLASDMTITNCYYLDEEILQEQTKKTLHSYTGTYGAKKLDYDGLRNLALRGMGNVANSTYTFAISSSLKNKRYPFPTALKDAKGNYVHYGDWPLDPSVRTYSKQYPAYYEIYQDHSVGICYVDYDGSVKSNLNDTEEIARTGYATIERVTSGETRTPIAEVVLDDADGRYCIYQDNSVENKENKINLPFCEDGKDFVFELVTTSGTTGTTQSTVSIPVYMNPKFGASISTSAALGTKESEPLQVRTAAQFVHVSAIACEKEAPVFVKQTRTVSLQNATASVSVKAGCTYDGGKTSGWKLIDAATAIFETNQGAIADVWAKESRQVFLETNEGTVNDCLVEAAEITSNDSQAAVFVLTNTGTIKTSDVTDATLTVQQGAAAGFALINKGTIQGCGVYSEAAYAKSSVKGIHAAGFVLSNQGTITTCFAAGSVEASETAAGFLLKNDATEAATVKESYASCQTSGMEACGFVADNQATIQNCYSAGTVKAAASGYGFGNNNSAKAEFKNCYSVCELEAKAGAQKLYGFGTAVLESSAQEQCYWGYSKQVNRELEQKSDEIGTRITFKKLKEMNTLGSLKVRSAADVPYTASLGKSYPYPAVNELVHYGDWPLAKGVTERNNTVKNGSYIGLFYYEKYEDDGAYGIYAIGLDAKNPTSDTGYWLSLKNFTNSPIINTLGASDEAVTESGCGIFYSRDLDTSRWAHAMTWNWNGWYEEYTTLDNITKACTPEDDSYAKYVFKLPADAEFRENGESNNKIYSQELYYKTGNGYGPPGNDSWLDKEYTLDWSTIERARPSEDS